MADGFNPAGMWAPNGRAFSQGVIQGPGQVVHVTGQVAWDEHSNVVGAGDAEAQMERSIANVRAILGDVGGTLDDIVSMTIYFLNRDDLPAIQRSIAVLRRRNRSRQRPHPGAGPGHSRAAGGAGPDRGRPARPVHATALIAPIEAYDIAPRTAAAAALDPTRERCAPRESYFDA